MAVASHLLDDCVDIVTNVARDHIMPRFLRSAHRHKADGSLVGEADLAASEALIAALQRLEPAPVVSEEMPKALQLSAWTAGEAGFWCVDPLDGTSNFAAGLPQFAVSAALLRAGRPVLGVIHAPMLRETFTATRAGGSRLNGDRLPVRTACERMGDAIAGADFKRLPRALAIRLATGSPVHSLRNLGSSALELAYTAAGRFDLYVHGAQKLWDYAAGALLIAESGGALATLEHDDFWAPDPWQHSVVAASHPDLLQPWKAWLRA